MVHLFFRTARRFGTCSRLARFPQCLNRREIHALLLLDSRLAEYTAIQFYQKGVSMFLKRFCVLALVASAILQAQTFTASLQGTVTDSTGAIVPNARITLVNEATNVNRVKSTDSRGAYLFTLLPPG